MKSPIATKLYYLLLGAIAGLSISAAIAGCKPEWTGNYYDGWREGIQFCNESQFDPTPNQPAKKPVALQLSPSPRPVN